MYICIYVYIYIFIILYLYFYLFIFRVKKPAMLHAGLDFKFGQSKIRVPVSSLVKLLCALVGRFESVFPNARSILDG